MAIRLYKDAELTLPLSDGGWSNPDLDAFDGTHGESHDRELYLANEHAVLADSIDAETLTLFLETAYFGNDEVVIVDAEQMKIVAGGGTTELTVQRGYAGTLAAPHELGATVYSGYNYTGISVGTVDSAGPDDTAWYSFAVSRQELNTVQPGVPLALADKTYQQTLSFWRRCTVPPGTPVQNKTDLRILVTGVENPIPW